MKRKYISIGYIYAIATGVILGLVPIIFQKVLTQEAIPRAMALFIKLTVTLPIFLPFSVHKNKKVQFPRHFGWKLSLCSLLYVSTLILLYESYHYIPTGIGVSLHYTFPLFTMVLSVLFFRFRCTRQSVVSMLLSVLGMLFLSSGSLSSGNAYIGIILAIGSAVTYATYFLWMEHAKLSSIDTTVFVPLKACLSAFFLLLYVMITDQLTFSMSFQSFLGLLMSGVFTMIASFCLTLAIRHIGSVHASILGSLEPIVCAVAGIVFLGEQVSLKNGIGILMVLTAAIMVTLNKQKTEK